MLHFKTTFLSALNWDYATLTSSLISKLDNPNNRRYYQSTSAIIILFTFIIFIFK